METSKITYKDLVALRDIVLQDPLALERWTQVIDHIVQRAEDRIRLKKYLRNSEFAEAVLQTFEIWDAHGKTTDIIKLFREHALNALADKVSAHPFGPQTNGTNADSVWFDVPELPFNYTGREQELEQVHLMLTPEVPESGRVASPAASNVFCIAGLGGIGKSTLACMYVNKFRKFHDDRVAWIHAESLHTLKTSFTALATCLWVSFTPEKKEPAPEVVVRLVYEKLTESGKKCLLVFDNVEEKDLLKQYQPRITNPDKVLPMVLVTCRRSDLVPQKANLYSLSIPSLDDAVQLIWSRLDPEVVPREAAEKLAHTLQMLPLAIQQAIAYIKEEYFEDDQCIDKYLEQYKTSQESIFKDIKFQEDNDYSLTLFTVWTLTIKTISAIDPSAIRLINSLSFMNPDNISIIFLRRIFEEKAEPNLKLLGKYSMVTLEASRGQVSIHRLVQAVLRVKLDPKNRSKSLDFIVQFVSELFVGFRAGSLWREAVSHGLYMFQFQKEHPELIKDESDYFDDLIYHLNGEGMYTDSLAVAQECGAFYEATFGANHETTMWMKWRTSHILIMLNKYEDAMKLTSEAIPVCQETFGDQHRLTLGMLDKHAGVLCEVGRLVEALRILDETISVRELLCHERHEEGCKLCKATLTQHLLCAKCTKAKVLLSTQINDVDGALALYLHAHKGLAELWGPNDLNTLHVQSEVGFSFILKGEKQKGLEILRDCYDRYCRNYGETHYCSKILKDELEECESECG